MSTCYLCGKKLKSGAGEELDRRAKEHVLRKRLIRVLGHQSLINQHNHKRRNFTDVRYRTIGPLSLVAGDICKGCNGGWIDDLDVSVEAEILAMARGTLHPSSLTAKQRFLLSR